MDLTIENLIKIILGVVVVAAIAYALYYFFANKVIDFFRNMSPSTGETAKLLMILY